ncbi:MAG: hypothetical protein IJN25_07515 [Clostridia bacterium]|nr:hypothetical protein [Oscillospiraceae bacterium]MBQ7033486.1 hypothetical protein [Clostridia bacterium]
MKRLNVVTGHFGSGKTEFALNLAMQNTGKTTIVDMDTVNPYYRTADAEGVLKSHGIGVILPRFANTNVDLPALPSEIFSVFTDKETTAVFDVGGDEDGALALGQYNRYFSEEPYEMYFIVNARRPLTREPDGVIEILREVENASHLRVTSLVNATNLGPETSAEIILEGQKVVEEVSRRTGIPVAFTAVREDIDIEALVQNPVMQLKLYIKTPF